MAVLSARRVPTGSGQWPVWGMRAVPGDKAECGYVFRKGDARRNAPQLARRADSRPFRLRQQRAGSNQSFRPWRDASGIRRVRDRDRRYAARQRAPRGSGRCSSNACSASRSRLNKSAATSASLMRRCPGARCVALMAPLWLHDELADDLARPQDPGGYGC